MRIERPGQPRDRMTKGTETHGRAAMPPPLSRLLLAALLPARLRPFVLDDLAEEFRARAADAGPTAARRWYRRQAIAGAWPALRLRGRALSGPLLGDSAHVMRLARRSPGFAVTTIVTLALAFAANTTIFSLVNGILLRPLPYPESERLVVIKHAMPAFEVSDALQSTGTYFLYRDNARSFADMGIYQAATVNLTGDGEATQVGLLMATPSLFATLGATPLLGRLFDEDDVAPGRDPVVVLTQALWRQRYGADETVVGRTVMINDAPREIVGVLGPDFDFPTDDAVMWMSNGDVRRGSARFADLYYGNVARLRPGVSRAEAEAELRGLAPALGEAYGDITPEMLAASGFTARVIDLKEEIVGDVDETLWMLLAAAGVVLLIAAANVANLFLVRAEYGRREVAMRRALGAGGGRLFAHALRESAVLCLLGGLLGLAASRGALVFLRAAGPKSLPRLHEVGLDAGVLGFAAVLVTLAALLFAIIPLLPHRAHALAEALRDGSRGTAGAGAAQRAGRGLVAVQAGMAVTLVIAALLLVQSFARLRAIDPGFDGGGVLALDFALPHRGYPDYERSAGFFRTLQERVEALPEVSAASAVGDLPLAPPQFPPTALALQAEGKVFASDELPPVGRLEFFLPGYFETMRIELRAGTLPDRGAGGLPDGSIVVSESLARQLWGDDGAVGRRLRYFGNGPSGAEPGKTRLELGPWWTVAAVVDDVLSDGLTLPPPAIVYLPVRERRVDPLRAPGAMTLVARGAIPPAALAPAIRAIVRDIDPDMPIANLRTVDSVVAAASARTSFTMLLLVTAAAAALFLGAVGMYGVASYAVGRRTREIGVRMALGASAADIGGMVLSQGAALLVAGLAAGLLVAAAMTRFAASLLYGVSATDPLAFVAAPLLLLAIALLATSLPARRAARVDPVKALGID